MQFILENDLSNSQILGYIKKYTNDETKRNFLEDRIIKGNTYENLCFFYPEWVAFRYKKMKNIVSGFNKWLKKEIDGE